MKVMSVYRPLRCPTCWLELRGVLPPEREFLSVCSACGGLCMYEPDGSRLSRLDPGELPARLAPQVAKLQADYDRNRRLGAVINGGPIYRWMVQPVCEPCHRWYAPDEPVDPMLGGEPEECALCGDETRSGVYRRILRDTRLWPRPVT